MNSAGKSAEPNKTERADDLAREQALDISQSILLQAPAGSGKTTVLTQRYLKLLATTSEPESVLAITFTRKAAGELRARVLRALAGDVPERSPADALTAEHARAAIARHPGLIESASRLKIMTIDSWNMSLASRLPITARSNVSLRVADNSTELYLRAAREALRAAEQDNELCGAVDIVLGRLDNEWRRLERLIVAMLAERNHWLPRVSQDGGHLPKAIESSLTAIIEDTLARTQQTLGVELCAEVTKLLPNCARTMRAADRELLAGYLPWLTTDGALTARAEDLARWRGVASFALTKTGGFRSPKGLGITSGVRIKPPQEKARAVAWIDAVGCLPGTQQLLDDIACLPDPQLDVETVEALEALGAVLIYAAQMLHVLFAETGVCDHIAVAGAARQALTEEGRPTDLAERLDLRLQHILVDEFQDTSHEQFHLLEALVANWSPNDGRTIFIVGDPMQSIYLFRNAEVGLFVRAREQGIGDIRFKTLQLRRNFRSAPPLVLRANDWFGRVFPPADDIRFGAIRHLASEPAAGDRGDGPFNVHHVAAAGRLAEAQHVARTVAELRRDHPGESIAVLAGARSHTLQICQQFRATGISYSGVKLTPLIDTSAIRDLEALTRALLNLADRTAWLASLRAPWCGLTLVDLTIIANTRMPIANEAPDSVEAAAAARDLPVVLSQLRTALAESGLSAEGTVRAARSLAVLDECLAERERRSLAEWVESAWLRLGGPATCVAAEELEGVRAFFAALQSHESQVGVPVGSELEALLADLYAPSNADDDAAVIVTTIFQAKGLEYDHVILPGVGRPTQRDRPPLMHWLELPRMQAKAVTDSSDLLVAPLKRLGGDDGPLDKLIKRYRARRQAFERARLLYVALTRARRSLHVYLHPRVDTNQDLSARKNSLLEPLWPVVAEHCARQQPLVDDTGSGTVLARTGNRLRRLKPDWRAPQGPADCIRASLDVGSLDDPLEFRWASETARQIGTAVHGALETIAMTAALDDEAAVAHLRAQLRTELVALGVPPADLDDATSRAATALDNTLQDPRGRWILSSEHRDAASELALSGVENQRIVSVVIDRTFVDADGVRWVVDFKTSPHEGGSVEQFLLEQTARYRAQLTRYVRLLEALKGGPVRAGLYFPLLKEWRECSLQTTADANEPRVD
ncbi:MAG: UvrD-helicase domain-containing protein [Steroidobacteraceae bacterium]